MVLGVLHADKKAFWATHNTAAPAPSTTLAANTNALWEWNIMAAQ